MALAKSGAGYRDGRLAAFGKHGKERDMKYSWCWLLAVPVFSQAAFAFDQCGPLTNAYGPYDYWVDKDRIGIVEVAHMREEGGFH